MPFAAVSAGVDCGWRGAMDDKQLHPHGLQYQDDSECCRGGLCGNLGLASDKPLEFSEHLQDHSMTASVVLGGVSSKTRPLPSYGCWFVLLS